jgi:hypothetical protein
VARANSPYGKLVITESDGQLDFIQNGVPLTSTHDDAHVEETAHYAMAQRPEARKVLLVSGGISGTAKEVLKYGVSQVDYVELDPLILALGRQYLPENLADRRIRTINTDGRLFIRRTGGQYDVIIVDVPEPSTAQLNRYYTAEFFADARRALSKDGVLCFPLGHYENYFSAELARLLASVRRSLDLVSKRAGGSRRAGFLPGVGRPALRGHRCANRAAANQDEAGEPPLSRRDADRGPEVGPRAGDGATGGGEPGFESGAVFLPRAPMDESV